MFKYAVVFLALVACTAAKPGFLSAPLAYTAPAAVVAAAPAPLVTATSSQVVARNYNGIAHAPVVAAAHVAASLAAAHVAAPLAAAPVAYSTPFGAKIVASPYAAAPLAYTHSFGAPLHYSYASAPLIL